PLKFGAQFFLRFVLCLAGDGTKQRAGRVLKRLNRAIRKRVTFLAPKFPADIARDVLRIKVHPIKNDARRFHHIVAHAVSRHPCNSVFSHRRWTLAASVATASGSALGSTRASHWAPRRMHPCFRTTRKSDENLMRKEFAKARAPSPAREGACAPRITLSREAE